MEPETRGIVFVLSAMYSLLTGLLIIVLNLDFAIWILTILAYPLLVLTFFVSSILLLYTIYDNRWSDNE